MRKSLSLLGVVAAVSAAVFFSGCAALGNLGDQYAQRVETQSVAVTVNGETKTAMVGTTITFRKPGEKPVAVTVAPTPTPAPTPAPTAAEEVLRHDLSKAQTER